MTQTPDPGDGPDRFGTVASSLVPMDLSPEPEGWAARPDDDDQGLPPVEAPDADLSGGPVQPSADALDGLEFDEGADLALLQEIGDRADD